MDEKIDSDLTMVASNVFNNVLQYVQNSSLNFQIQMSPFSAIISLKKSFVKNKHGTPILPTLPISEDLKRSLTLELDAMKTKYENLLHEHARSLEMIKVLENDLARKDKTLSNFLTSTITAQDSDEVLNLDKNEFNFDLAELDTMKPLHNVEEGDPKKDLETKTNCGSLKTASKPRVPQPSGTRQDLLDLSSHAAVCSICANILPNYSPQYYSGYKLHPACDTCLKKEHLNDQEESPFSAFLSGEIPSSLVTHWVQPSRLPPTPSISSSVSFRSHCIKFPNPGQVLYTAEDILQELQELMRKSKWWT